MKLFLALLMCAALGACAGTGARDAEAIDAAIANADTGTALIARRTGLPGAVYRIVVKLDGVEVAALGTGEVASFQVPDGAHVLEAQFEGPAQIGVKKGELSFTKDPALPQYFLLSLKTGLIGATLNLHELKADSFASAVR